MCLSPLPCFWRAECSRYAGSRHCGCWVRLQKMDGWGVAFNDVDLCTRNVWMPYAELYHYESKSRGMDEPREQYFRYAGEVERFKKHWMHRLLKGDPCHNRNLTQLHIDFGTSDAEE